MTVTCGVEACELAGRVFVVPDRFADADIDCGGCGQPLTKTP